ncbi:MAG TPA: hypothetical protein IGS51_17160, partial [Thermoleptolyngbya sp. M55_K2018_002]
MELINGPYQIPPPKGWSPPVEPVPPAQASAHQTSANLPLYPIEYRPISPPIGSRPVGATVPPPIGSTPANLPIQPPIGSRPVNLPIQPPIGSAPANLPIQPP